MVKTKLTKEVFQELLNNSEGSFAKELNRFLKENQFVEVFCDKVSPLTLVFSDCSSGAVEFSEEHEHYVAKYSYIHPKCVSQDIYELEENSYILIPCDELVAPKYNIITVKDILTLPKKDTSLCIADLLDEILDKTSSDYVDDYYNVENKKVTVFKLMGYSQGYSGKYGQEIYVVSFDNEDVALVSAHGKWTDTYRITPVSESYTKMCLYLEDLYVDKTYDEKPLTLDDEYEMVNILEDMFWNKEYIKHEAE